MALAVRRPRLSLGRRRPVRERARLRRTTESRRHSTIAPGFGGGIGAQGSVRRRRRHALSLPGELGAEISLPALPKFRLGPRTITALLIGAWLLTAQRAWANDRLRVAEVTIEGASLMSDAQIDSIAGLRGSHLFTVDPRAAEERLVAYPEIDGARVQVKWPGNRVAIEVEERRPIVKWHDGGKTWWLSASAVAFIQREPYKAMVEVTSEEPVLNISQDALQPAVEPEVLWTAVKISEQLPYATELTYNQADGFGFQDPHGWRVIFGQGGDIETKVNVYRAIALSLAERGLNVELVSVQDPASPYYRLTR